MKSIAPTWIGWYVITFVVHIFTMPAHSDFWSGVLFGLITAVIGADRLAAAGARPGTCFVYGCGATVLFLPRFVGMDRFSVWLQDVAPSTEATVVQWIALSLLFGAICAVIGMFHTAANADPSDSSPKP